MLAEKSAKEEVSLPISTLEIKCQENLFKVASGDRVWCASLFDSIPMEQRETFRVLHDLVVNETAASPALDGAEILNTDSLMLPVPSAASNRSSAAIGADGDSAPSASSDQQATMTPTGGIWGQSSLQIFREIQRMSEGLSLPSLQVCCEIKKIMLQKFINLNS